MIQGIQRSETVCYDDPIIKLRLKDITIMKGVDLHINMPKIDDVGSFVNPSSTRMTISGNLRSGCYKMV